MKNLRLPVVLAGVALLLGGNLAKADVLQGIVSALPAPPEQTHDGPLLQMERTLETDFNAHTMERIVLNAPSAPASLSKIVIENHGHRRSKTVNFRIPLESRSPFDAIHVGILLYSVDRRPTHRLLLEARHPRPAGDAVVKGTLRMKDEDRLRHLYAVAYVHAVDLPDGTEWRHDPAALAATLATIRKNGPSAP